MIKCLLASTTSSFYMSRCRAQPSRSFTKWSRAHVGSTQHALDSIDHLQRSSAKCPMWSMLIHLWPVSCASLHRLPHPSARCHPSLSSRTQRSCHPSPHRPSVSEVPVWVCHFGKYNSTIAWSLQLPHVRAPRENVLDAESVKCP